MEKKDDWVADPKIVMIIDNPLDTAIRAWIKRRKEWIKKTWR